MKRNTMKRNTWYLIDYRKRNGSAIARGPKWFVVLLTNLSAGTDAYQPSSCSMVKVKVKGFTSHK